MLCAQYTSRGNQMLVHYMNFKMHKKYVFLVSNVCLYILNYILLV